MNFFISPFDFSVPPRCEQVSNVSGDHQYAAACVIARVFRRVSDRKFRKKIYGRKIFGPKSRAIAPKSAFLDYAWPRRGTEKSNGEIGVG